MKYLPFIFVKITWIGSIGQLHFDSSISELRYLASETFFNDSPFARMIKVLPLACSSLFTGDIFLYCSKTLSNRFTLSCKCINTLIAFCFFENCVRF